MNLVSECFRWRRLAVLVLVAVCLAATVDALSSSRTHTTATTTATVTVTQCLTLSSTKTVPDTSTKTASSAASGSDTRVKSASDNGPSATSTLPPTRVSPMLSESSTVSRRMLQTTSPGLTDSGLSLEATVSQSVSSSLRDSSGSASVSASGPPRSPSESLSRFSPTSSPTASVSSNATGTATVDPHTGSSTVSRTDTLTRLHSASASRRSQTASSLTAGSVSPTFSHKRSRSSSKSGPASASVSASVSDSRLSPSVWQSSSATASTTLSLSSTASPSESRTAGFSSMSRSTSPTASSSTTASASASATAGFWSSTDSLSVSAPSATDGPSRTGSDSVTLRGRTASESATGGFSLSWTFSRPFSRTKRRSADVSATDSISRSPSLSVSASPSGAPSASDSFSRTVLSETGQLTASNSSSPTRSRTQTYSQIGRTHSVSPSATFGARSKSESLSVTFSARGRSATLTDTVTASHLSLTLSLSRNVPTGTSTLSQMPDSRTVTWTATESEQATASITPPSPTISHLATLSDSATQATFSWQASHTESKTGRTRLPSRSGLSSSISYSNSPTPTTSPTVTLTVNDSTRTPSGDVTASLQPSRATVHLSASNGTFTGSPGSPTQTFSATETPTPTPTPRLTHTWIRGNSNTPNRSTSASLRDSRTVSRRLSLSYTASIPQPIGLLANSVQMLLDTVFNPTTASCQVFLVGVVNLVLAAFVLVGLVVKAVRRMLRLFPETNAGSESCLVAACCFWSKRYRASRETNDGEPSVFDLLCRHHVYLGVLFPCHSECRWVHAALLLLSFNLFYFFASVVLYRTSRDLVVESSAPRPAEALAMIIGIAAAHLLRTIPDLLLRSSYLDPADIPRCTDDPDTAEKKKLRQGARSAAKAVDAAAAAVEEAAVAQEEAHAKRLASRMAAAAEAQSPQQQQAKASKKHGKRKKGKPGKDSAEAADAAAASGDDGGEAFASLPEGPPPPDLRAVALHAEFNVDEVAWRLAADPLEPPPNGPHIAHIADFDICPRRHPADHDTDDGSSTHGGGGDATAPIDVDDVDEIVVWCDPVVPPTNMHGPLATRYLPVGTAVLLLSVVLLAGTVHFAARAPRQQPAAAATRTDNAGGACRVDTDPWTRLAAVHLLVDVLFVETGRMLLQLLVRYSKEDDNTVDFSASTSHRLRQLLATDGHPVWKALVRWPDEMFKAA